MIVFLVGGLKELDQFSCRRTRGFRIDDCPVREVACDLDTLAERAQRVRRMKRIVQEKLKENGS